MNVYRIENDCVTEVNTPEMQDALDVVLNAHDRGMTRLEIRKAIRNLEIIMGAMPQRDQPLRHDFVDRLYRRTIHNPKGSLVVTKIHKEPNFSFVMHGKLLVVSEDENSVIESPDMFPTCPGTKRVIYAIEDTVFVTVHPNPENTQSIEELENRIIAKTFDDLEIDAEIVQEVGVQS